jgi:tetratricopeptide (TPR) repeat protein
MSANMCIGRAIVAFAMGLSAALAGSVPALAKDFDFGDVAPMPVTPAERHFDAGVKALEINNLAAAEAAFRESLKLDAKAAAPYMGLAQVALRRGQNDAARKFMEQAVAFAPEAASVQTTWGTYLFASRELPEAEAALRKAASLDARNVIARIHLGDLYLTGFRKADDAIAQYKAALAIDPTHPGAHYAMGLALLLKRDPAAERELTEAAKLAPANPLPLHALGRMYTSAKRYDEALQAFERTIKVAPLFPAPHVERGHILLARNNAAGAILEYQIAQQKDPKRSVGLTNVGMAEQSRGRWAEAERAYLAAVKIEPKNVVAYNNLAWMAADRKVNLGSALQWAQKAVSLAPAVPEVVGTLGWVYRAQGDLAKAEETLRRAASLKPERADVAYNLGRVCLERGKTKEGLAQLQKALALDPAFAGAAEARKTLQQVRP